VRDTEENRRTHLELIEKVIARLGQNQFLFKGWSITLVSAIVALASLDARDEVVLVAFLPAIAFWALDAYNLRNECLFRELFSHVHSAPEGSLEVFSMKTDAFRPNVKSFVGMAIRPITMFFHLPVVVVLIIVTIALLTNQPDAAVDSLPQVEAAP
jgi:hypothetical protein